LKENVQMCLEEIEYEGVSWSHLAQGRIWYWATVNKVTNIQVP
jgi:hypothetical protein